MAEKLTEFNKVYDQLVREGVDRRGITFGSIHEHLGCSRQNINNARTKPIAISMPRLLQVMDFLDTPEEVRDHALTAWFEERMADNRSWGSAVEFLLKTLKSEFSVTKYRRLVSEAAKEVQAGKSKM